jgi:hypothetical protein
MRATVLVVIGHPYRCPMHCIRMDDVGIRLDRRGAVHQRRCIGQLLLAGYAPPVEGWDRYDLVGDNSASRIF